VIRNYSQTEVKEEQRNLTINRRGRIIEMHAAVAIVTGNGEHW